MRERRALLLAALLFSAPAVAGDYTVAELLTISNGLQIVNAGRAVIVKDGGKEMVVTEKFHLTPNVRVAVARNLVRIAAALQSFEQERRAVAQALCPEACEGAAKDRLEAEILKLGGKRVSVDLVDLSREDLNLEANPDLGGDALFDLKPVLPWLDAK